MSKIDLYRVTVEYNKANKNYVMARYLGNKQLEVVSVDSSDIEDQESLLEFVENFRKYGPDYD